MPKIERHEPGTFCWPELSSRNGPDAKRFYTELFGWESQDDSMGAEGVPTMLRLHGAEVGGAAGPRGRGLLRLAAEKTYRERPSPSFG